MDRQPAMSFSQPPDKPLLEQLLKSQSGPLFRYFRSKGGCGYEEDLVQEACLKLSRHLGTNPSITLEDAKNLLWFNAKQVLCDHLKWKKRLKRAPELRAHIAIDDIDPNYLASGTDTAELLAVQELLNLLSQAWQQKLNPLVARRLEMWAKGCTWKEITTDWKVTEWTARKRLARALAVLVLAEPALGNDLLRELEQAHTLKAVRAVPLWANGKKPGDIAKELRISIEEAQKLENVLIAFFSARLRRNAERRVRPPQPGDRP